ncbi:HNH endonuclease [Clostridium sp. ZS2-4]|uniref:HNH endonuclease n=1 Tax=Clostridium sp. ZS2-4 TaxID=2987703 RepID=UPI00227D6E30|nr:HNH endonuclease [Clostridium sp. ZS2-4]MCY6356674.1 HNH endonuclease [Clostridium sp. ZS2-4]
MKECCICGKTGEKHHIVFKNQGGIDIPLNYIYLCAEHHRGEFGPHKNRVIDIAYKTKMQNELMRLLSKDYYCMDELIKLLKINPFQAKIIQKDLNLYKLGFKKLDIIKRIMGRKLYGIT